MAKHRVKRGEGGIDYLQDRKKWRKTYYVDIIDQETREMRRVARSVTHDDMTEAIRLADEKKRENDLWWERLRTQRIDEPELTAPRSEQTLAIKAPKERLDFLPTVCDNYISSRVRFRADGSVRALKTTSKDRYKVWISNATSASFGSLDTKPMRYLRLDEDLLPHFVKHLGVCDADTSRKYRGFLISVGNYAVQNEIWPINLFALLPPVEGSALTTEKRILALAEVDALYEVLRNELFKTAKVRASLVATIRLLRLGLRPEEVFALSTDDIVDEETIMINYGQTTRMPDWAESAEGVNCWLEEPKTFASRSKVTIPREWMRDILCATQRSKPFFVPAYDDKAERGGTSKARRFLVPNLQGHAWLQNNALRMVKQLFEKAEVSITVKNARNTRWLYVFRYTYASEIYALGCSDVEAMALMRHRDAVTSKLIYARARDKYLNIYRAYRAEIKDLSDYNKTICKMDADRAAKSGFWEGHGNEAPKESDSSRMKLLAEFGIE